MSDKNGVIFVDVREQDEYAAGHIPGAKSIPRTHISFKPGASIISDLLAGGRDAK